MKQINFSDGMKPLTADMNNLHLYTEEAVYTLLQAMGGSTGGLLFEALEPTAGVVSDTLTITVAEQHFAIDGAVGLAPETTATFDVTGTDAKVAVYLLLKKAGVEDERNFISLDTDTGLLVQQDLTTIVEYDDETRVEFIDTYDGSTPDEPPLGAGDVGFVKLGSYDWDSGTTTLTYTANTSAHFTLPANVQQALTTHGVEHLSTGDDPIPVSELDNVSGGSTEGLMPNGALTAALGAVQDIVGATTFIEVASEDSNEVSGNDILPKTVTINIALDDSLAETVDGTLGVVFPTTSARAGYETRAARADHVHALIETGLISYTLLIDVPSDSTLLGQVLGPYTVSSQSSGGDGTDDIGRIVSIRVSWIPPGVSGNYYGIDCGWATIEQQGTQTIGCRSIVGGQTSFYLETGNLGLAYLTAAITTHINSTMSGNWQLGTYAKGGTLKVDVLAIRVGSHSDGVTSV